MNKQIKRLSVVVLVLFLSLFISTMNYQVLLSSSLKKDPRNLRTFYESFNKDRGEITTADGVVLAKSTSTKDDFKFLRSYKQGSVYAPVTGFYSTANGMSGIENEMNSVLTGDSDAFALSKLSNIIVGKKPKGGSVELTINSKAQLAAFNAFGKQHGALVALDATTGEILAMVSKPSYNPNQLAEHNTYKSSENYKNLVTNKQNPMLNRAINQLYAPGSTFKLVTAATALETGKWTANTNIPAPNSYKLPNSQSELKNMNNSTCSQNGKITITRALDISCNTAFAMLGAKLGGAKLQQQAEKFGFGTKFELPIFTSESEFPKNIDKAQTAMSAIGQYNNKLTVLQNALIVAGIVNDGVVMEPHLVKTLKNGDGKNISITQPKEFSQAVSESTATQLQKMMQSVATNGTGTVVKIPGIVVGAKTGTAQKEKGKMPNNWFVAYAKSSANTKIAVAVLVENGGTLGFNGTGSQVAGPIAKRVLQECLKL